MMAFAEKAAEKVCQYPKSDNIHFYLLQLMDQLSLMMSVNTLNRIIFISTKEKKTTRILAIIVSIP